MLRSISRYVRRNAVAFLALFVALGGTATATHLAVNGSDVVNESLTGEDIRGKASTGVPGTIKGEDLAAGAVDSERALDGSLAGVDVQNRSLSLVDLDLFTRNRVFVRTHRSDEMLLDVNSGTTAIGEWEIVASMTRTTQSENGGSTSNQGFLRVECTETGFKVRYENIESGFQRVWYDIGSSIRYRTLGADTEFTLLDSGASIPEARRVSLRVHSNNLGLDAAFDVMVVRLQQGRSEPCLWHASGANAADV